MATLSNIHGNQQMSSQSQQQQPIASTSQYDPLTRSRTLLFLSIRDSRPRRHRSNGTFPATASKGGANGNGAGGGAFVLYDDEDDDDTAENARLLGTAVPTPTPGPGVNKKKLAQQQGHIALEMDEPGLPPAWVDIAHRVEEILRGTHAKISTLDKLHARHALPGFTDRTAEERDIERMTTEITRDFRQCHNLIQKIAAEPTPIPSTQSGGEHSFPPQARKMKPPSANAVLAAKNVQRGLAAKIQETSGLFRKKQKVYMDRLQGHAIKNQDLLIASGVISLQGSEGMSAVEEDMAASQSQLSTQTQQTQQIDTQTQERTRELAEIAKNIASLAELFKDLSSMVIEQGTILDSVEWNVERTADSMEAAVKELKIAQGYQRNTGRRQCILFLVLLIFAALVVLIFKPKRSSQPAAPASSVHVSR